MKKLLFGALTLALTITLMSCEKGESSTDGSSTDGSSVTALKTRNGSISNPSFILEYQPEEGARSGFVITSSGQVHSYSITEEFTTSLTPGAMGDILVYFEDASSQLIASTTEEVVTSAKNQAATMHENDLNLIEYNGPYYSEAAEGQGMVQLYDVQESGPGVDYYYPLRILEGGYENSWWVNSENPLGLLNLIDQALTGIGGLDPDFWGHYDFKEEE